MPIRRLPDGPAIGGTGRDLTPACMSSIFVFWVMSSRLDNNQSGRGGQRVYGDRWRGITRGAKRGVAPTPHPPEARAETHQADGRSAVPGDRMTGLRAGTQGRMAGRLGFAAVWDAPALCCALCGRPMTAVSSWRRTAGDNKTSRPKQPGRLVVSARVVCGRGTRWFLVAGHLGWGRLPILVSLHPWQHHDRGPLWVYLPAVCQ